MRPFQTVISLAGNRQHRRAIQLGIIEAVEQMNRTRPGGRRAHPQPAGIFGIGAGHERRRFLVPHLYETQALLALPQRLEKTVNTIAWEAKNGVHAPVFKRIGHHIGNGARLTAAEHKGNCRHDASYEKPWRHRGCIPEPGEPILYAATTGKRAIAKHTNTIYVISARGAIGKSLRIKDESGTSAAA